MPLCSIIIRAYNEEKHIGRLLEVIHKQSFQDFEIILVDSGSTDETVAIAKKHHARVVAIRPEDFTFGYALNQGIQAAAGEIIVLASAHVYPVYPDWLENLHNALSDPKVAVAYGKQRGAATTYFSEHQIFARWFPDESNLKQDHPFCNNANAAIRRSLWLEHPYDESLTGLEDLAWAKNSIKLGYYLAYVAEAEIIHIHDEQPRQVNQPLTAPLRQTFYYPRCRKKERSTERKVNPIRYNHSQ